MINWQDKVRERLGFIYKKSISEDQIMLFLSLVEKNVSNAPNTSYRWSQEDIALITYGDSIIDEKEIPLQSLKAFLDKKLKGVINNVHILPFFPFSSDDGFSVIDFKQVNPDLGNWLNIKEISKEYRLMADLVINHASSKGEWFNNFLKGHGEGNDFFLKENPNTDLSLVTRPRNSPLLTEYKTASGIEHIWTTFSADQIDLNFANPEVLIAMFDVLIHYLKNGAKIIRLDAIAFLWKEIGTTCLHLPETHELVKLMRDIAELVCPGVIIITETNVPNIENLSYFGSNDEAHMVYQFSLPPLLLHALNTANGEYLSQWAQTIPNLNKNCSFLNFTSSHDGIGVRPLEGLLPNSEKELLFKDIEKAGGLISMKTNTDGSSSPYELNITYFDAMKLTRKGADEYQNERFICSQTIMMTMKGIPAFYIHSLLASPNYKAGVEQTGRARTINREKLNKKELYYELDNDSNRKLVFNELVKLINTRKKHKAFHPSAYQIVFDYGNSFFVVYRKSENGEELLSISNLTSEKQSIKLNSNQKHLTTDIISRKEYSMSDITLRPYQTQWLIKK